MVRAAWFALAFAQVAWVGLCARPRVHADAREPSSDGLAARLEGIEQIVSEAIARRELPGCVIAIGTHAGPVYTRAFGERTAGEAMTTDTLFDLASLTKPLATATAIALLAERGSLALDQPASRFVSELERQDKRAISLRQLLLHTSGLPSVSPLADFEHGWTHARTQIAALPLKSKPGTTFDYSDLGYILLGQVVQQVARQPLETFVRRELFEPLGMRDTQFGVRAADVARTAPTELRVRTRTGARERNDSEHAIRGEVDDPRAFRLGGVAGHAGLFSSAGDVARFAQMLLRGGQLEGKRVLSEQTVNALLAVRSAGAVSRTLGWDVDSPYAHGRGRLLSASAVGHGGYTGTSLWIDREQDLYVVLLSNRVHVGERGTIHPLASSVADIAARALRARPEGLRVGIDVVAAEGYARLRGRQIALLTHAAARDHGGATTLALLSAAPSLRLRAILTPEHGLSGKHEGKIADSRHGSVPIYSLFGATRRPSAAMLAGIDTIVIDLVDVGTRFYTYMATVLATLEAAGELGLPVLLLDRPNPLDGVHIEGPVSEPAFASFVNYHPLPLRHGMTAGELARFLCRARALPVRLSVVRAEGWDRRRWSGELDLRWEPPSPNLGSKQQALLYPAVGLIEGTNLSVGRGTADAFRVVGAPFLDGDALARALERQALVGVRVQATRFRPRVGPYARQTIEGVKLTVEDPARFSAAYTGLALIRALSELHREQWDATRLERLVAHRATLTQLAAGAPLSAIAASWAADLEAFARARGTVLLY